MEIDNHQISSVALKIHHDNIVQDIQGDVTVALFQENVLTEDEYIKIISEKNRLMEATHLLEILQSKNSYGINQFIKYLLKYYSWIAEPIEISITNEYKNGLYLTKLQDVLTSGEVPQLSSRHVSRTKHVKMLKDYLKKLEPGHFIIVNGMNGCGKSSLIAEVLNDPLITMQYFQGFVQWINVGKDDCIDVGCIQTEIINRLSDQELLISPPLSTDYEATKKTLRTLWKQKNLMNGLLILDDVYSKQIVKYLDFGCKILITTCDKSIMDDIVDTRVEYIKVNEGFEEKETLDLFSKCLSINVEFLPSHASKLHYVCKGFPLTISLIGAQLETHKEETINNVDRWTFYLEELSDKSSEPFRYTLRSDKQVKSLEKAIEMCINSLSYDLQKNYQDFSLFVPDLNIKPEVLSVLWNLKKIQVEDILLEFIRKSLLIRAWNQPLNSYVYSIHDLLLSNIKKKMNYQDFKELHIKLIERYRIYCNGNFAELPKNDNYIFLYFGYHLKNADMLEEFPRWFLNLKFLESKICVAGPADLLTDLRKYRKYIVVRSIYEEYIKEIEHFVKSNGPNLYQTKCDIVQLGLLEPETSYIYKESYKIAKVSEKSYFYYNIRASQSCLPTLHISVVRDKIGTVIFGNNHDEVIIGTQSGSIKVWNIMSQKCLYTYDGHTGKIIHLVKNKLKNLFLSTSFDSTIRIWNMHNFSVYDDSETRTPSPETRQEHWQNVFNQNCKKPTDIADCIGVLNHNSGPVIFAQFSFDDKLIVSSAVDKTLKVWILKDTCRLFKTVKQSSIIYRCYFMENIRNDCIIFLTQSQTGSGIYFCQFPFDHCTGLLYLKEKVLSLFLLPNTEGDDKLLIMTPKKLCCYKFKWDEPICLIEHSYPLNYQYFHLSSISERYTSKTNNSRFIAFSLTNCKIKVYDMLTGYFILDLNDPIRGILSLDWFWSKKDQNNWLLCASEDKCIRLWCLNGISQYTCAHQTNSINKSNNNFENICKNEIISLKNYKLFSEDQNLYCYKFKPIFDAVWLDNNLFLLAAITECGTLKILFDGLDQWSMIDKRVSALSIVNLDQKLDKTIIIVACEDLSVHLLKFQSSQYLFNTIDNAQQIFVCFDHSDLTLAVLLNKKDDSAEQVIEIWANKKNINLNIKHFINCFVFHDKVIVLCNIHEVKVINLCALTLANLEMNCIKINGSLMLDHSTLVVTYNANTLNIINLTSDLKLNPIDQYALPFKESESISISMSNDKHLFAVSGQNNIILINKISKTTIVIIDPSMNNIQSMVWSADDTRLAIKDDNQIIIFNVETGNKIASVTLTSDKFLVDSVFSRFIAINTAGKLVIFNLLSDINC